MEPTLLEAMDRTRTAPGRAVVGGLPEAHHRSIGTASLLPQRPTARLRSMPCKSNTRDAELEVSIEDHSKRTVMGRWRVSAASAMAALPRLVPNGRHRPDRTGV